MENKLTQSHLDLIHKILRIKLTEKELAEVMAMAKEIKEKQTNPQSISLK